MAVEGLLILDDGTVQVIGQPKTLTPFIPWLDQLTDQLREREREEAKQNLANLSIEELREELERRSSEDIAAPSRRTQKLKEAE